METDTSPEAAEAQGASQVLDYLRQQYQGGRVALADVAAERIRQDAKWGIQDHPDGTGPDAVLAGGYAEWVRDHARLSCQVQAGRNSVTWLDIAMEEVAEAFSEEDPARLRTELIQAAAVFVAWAEDIDRRTLS